MDLSAGNRQTMTPEAMPSKFPASFALETSHCLYACGDTIGARLSFHFFLLFLGNVCVGYTEHPGWGKGCSRHRSLVTYQFLGSVICTARMLYDVMCCTYMFCFDLVIFLRLLWSCVALLRRGSRQLPALTRCLQANPILDRRQSGPTFSNSSAAHRKRLLEVCATVVFALVRTRCNLAPSRWSTRQTTWPQARQQTGPYQTTGIESPGSEVRGSPVSAFYLGTDANDCLELIASARNNIYGRWKRRCRGCERHTHRRFRRPT